MNGHIWSDGSFCVRDSSIGGNQKMNWRNYILYHCRNTGFPYVPNRDLVSPVVGVVIQGTSRRIFFVGELEAFLVRYSRALACQMVYELFLALERELICKGPDRFTQVNIVVTRNTGSKVNSPRCGVIPFISPLVLLSNSQ